jgi:hypothetical protein
MGGVRSTHGGYETFTPSSGGNVKERDQSEDLGIAGRIILEWILRSGYGAVASSCEHGNEPSGYFLTS